jgi:NAD(P)-dependent dehydrogenase (short-subunit alcohol dehydrogenase family)
MLTVCWNVGYFVQGSRFGNLPFTWPTVSPLATNHPLTSQNSGSRILIFYTLPPSIGVDQFDSIFRTNTTGPYYLSRALMRSWLGLPISLSSSSSEVNLTADDGQPKKNLKGKQILFVSSISGLVAMTPQYQAAYNASKAGVTMLAKVRRGVLPC